MNSKIVDYVGDHPVVGLGALQAGGSLLTGLTNTLTPAQVNQANAQANANNAAAALVKLQTANLSAPKAVASAMPVTGAPQPLVPTGAGGAVTGAPTASGPPPTAPQMALSGLINRAAPLVVTGAPA